MAKRAVGSRLGRIVAQSGEADVWFARVSEYASELDWLSREMMSSEERRTMADHRLPEAAQRYAVTRSLVRSVLSGHLGLPPQEILVARTGAGKPIVSQGIHFNVSHSGDLALVAVCDTRAVGVDVERRRDVSRVEAMIERWLTRVERAELDDIVSRGVSASDAFLRVWSLKEARLKALGVGISGAANAAVHEVEAHPLDALLDARTHGTSDQGYVGALAFA